MYQIAICEDMQAQKEYLISVIRNWQKMNPKVKIRIDAYDNAEQFLFAYEDQPDYDLLILDIEMGEMNGMELAKRVRSNNKSIQIVFITGYKEYVFEGYEVGAVRYLLKPLKEKDFLKILDMLCVEHRREEKDYYLITYNGVTHKVDFSSMLYLEANGHYVKLKTIDSEYEWKTSISSIADEFEKHHFIMIRRGLYVNLDHVQRIGRSECHMDNDEILPISKNCYQQLNEAFIQYYRGKASFEI